MTGDNFLEQIRDGQAPNEGALKKHMGSYRTKEVDQYIEKLLAQLQNMETVFQERFEEMRTNQLAITRERDRQTERANDLENRLNDMPKICAAYLKELGQIALPKEQYECIQSIDLDEYESNKKLSAKQQLLELENLRLAGEAETLRAALKTAQETNKKLEQTEILAQTQADEISRLKLQWQTQTELSETLRDEAQKLEEAGQSMAAQIAQAQARHQMLELAHRLAVEMNEQLTREKACQEKEAARLKEFWEAERGFLIQRFNGILHSQKQYMQHMQESVNAAMQYMGKLSEAEFLDAAPEEAENEIVSADIA